MYLQLNSKDLPDNVNGVEVIKKDISFKIESTHVIAYQIINRKRYAIKKKLTTNSIDYLWKVLTNIAQLPDEFWQLEND